MNKKTLAITITLLAAIMLAAQLAATVQACAPKKHVNAQHFLLHMEDSTFNYDNARWKYYPMGIGGEGPPPLTPPDGARFMILRGAKSELNPATDNYIRIGETEIKLDPEDYYSTYDNCWFYDGVGVNTGRGLYKVYERITLDSDGLVGTIEIRTISVDHYDGVNFWGQGVFFGHGTINGEKVTLMGKSETNLVIPHFILERDGTILFH